MRTESAPQHAATLRDYLKVVQRRRWIILQAVLLVPCAAVLLSLHMKAVYESTSEVLLNQQNSSLPAQLSGLPGATSYAQPGASGPTAAGVARAPGLASRVLRAVGVHHSPDYLLNSSSVTAEPNKDLLEFAVRNGDRVLAQRLASSYARGYIRFKQEQDALPLQRALDKVHARLSELENAGNTHSQAYDDALAKEDTLNTMLALTTGNAQVVRLGSEAVKVSPKPVRNGILGFLLGLLLGVGLAFLWESLDTRVRGADEIAQRIGLPLLARLPEPPRKYRKSDRLVMLVEPRGIQAEAFRMLRTNLEFTRLERDAKLIMITSSVEQEGKSTTVANLAVALARAGQNVALVDLDLRRPFIDRFFDLRFRPGLTQVALGHATLDEALIPVAIPDGDVNRKLGKKDDHANGNGNGNGNGHANGNGSGAAPAGMLNVMIAGPMPPNPGEFVGGQALTDILGELRERFDTVLVDAPPSLQVGDAMAISAKVDAMMVITRLNTVRRTMLDELRRLLDHSPAEKLGFIVTDAQSESGYGYGDGYYGSYERTEEKEHVA